jgi:hypothetical protein
MLDNSFSKRGGAAKMHPTLTKVLYNCSPESTYMSQKQSAAADNKHKAKAAAKAARLSDGPARSRITFSEVERSAMREHLTKVMHADSIYSCSRSCLSLESLSHTLEQPSTKRRRTEQDSNGSAAGIEAERLGSNDVVEDEPVYFKLILANLGRKKTVKVPVGAGGRVAQDRVLVSLHQPLSGFDKVVINARPCTTERSPDPAFLINGWAEDAEVKQHFLSYPSEGLRWTLADFVLPDGISDADVTTVVEKLMVSGAHATGRLAMGIALPASEVPCARALEAAGTVLHTDTDRWFLTHAGVHGLASCISLGPSRPIFDVRPDLAIEDMTSFELISTLGSQGWAWRQWYTPNTKPKRVDPIPLGYTAGAPKVWFTSRTVCRGYLQALLKSEDRACK